MRRMRVLGAAAALLMVAGCTVPSSTSEYRPAPTNPPRQAPSQTDAKPAPLSVDDVYISTLRDEYPEVVATMGRSWLIEFGNTVCDALDSGITWTEIVLMGMDAELEMTMLGYVMGAGIAAYCPWNAPKIG